MGCGVEVAQSLRKRETAHEEGVLEAQDLDHTAGPPNALANVRRQALGRQTRSLRDIRGARFPAAARPAQGCVAVFGSRPHRDAAYLIERVSSQHRAGATKEAGIPQVVPVLDETVKQFALVRNLSKLAQIALEWVG